MLARPLKHPTLSVRLIQPFLRTLVAQGVDATPLIAAIGPDLEKLQDPDARISRDFAMRLLDRAVVESGDEALGVHAAEQVQNGDFDALELVVRASRSRREALLAVQRYVGLMIDGVSMLHDLEPPMEAWTLVFPADSSRVAVEFAFGAMLIVGSTLADGNQRPYELEFAHPKPARPAEFERVFDCPVHWSAPRNALHMATDRLDRKIAHFTPSVTTAIENHAAKLLAGIGSTASFSDRVREHIAVALRSGPATAEDLCQRMKISERSLRRKLQDEGQSFSDLRSEVLRELARQHLADPNVSITETAFLLGFSGSRAFQRAFKRWHGIAPSEYRRKAGVSR